VLPTLQKYSKPSWENILSSHPESQPSETKNFKNLIDLQKKHLMAQKEKPQPINGSHSSCIWGFPTEIFTSKIWLQTFPVLYRKSSRFPGKKPMASKHEALAAGENHRTSAQAAGWKCVAT